MSRDLGNEINLSVNSLVSALLDVAASGKTRSELDASFADELENKIKELIEAVRQE